MSKPAGAAKRSPERRAAAAARRKARQSGQSREEIDEKPITRGRLTWLRNTFQRRGQLGQLLDLLLEDKDRLDRIETIAEVLLLAKGLDRQKEAAGILLTGDPTQRTMPWGSDFYMGAYASLGLEMRRHLRILKYGRNQAGSAAELAEVAQRAAERIVFPAGLLDRLFAASRFRSLGRETWERRMRVAFVYDHISSEFIGRPPRKLPLEQFVSPDAFAEVGRLADAPTLILTFHGGFLTLTKAVVVRALPAGKRIQAAPPRREQEISVRGDQATALFSALRALQDGSQLVIAADANVGKLKSSIEVAGQTVPTAEGAAFLAYESGCRTVWLVMRRAGDGFVPYLAEAPRVEPAESFRAFVARFQRFYGERIDELVTGDPDHLALRVQWVRALTPDAAQAELGSDPDDE